jgi:hypothetical protein
MYVQQPQLPEYASGIIDHHARLSSSGETPNLWDQ